MSDNRTMADCIAEIVDQALVGLECYPNADMVTYATQTLATLYWMDEEKAQERVERFRMLAILAGEEF